MESIEFEPSALGRRCLLITPDAPASRCGGIVALHGSSLPQREQPIFQHLAETLGPLGFTTMSYDRRPTFNGDDTPIEIQAQDASTAVEVLRHQIRAPVGLFGFSQGAWAASLAAAGDSSIAFLILVGCSGVSPAEQMRFYTDELLRRAGYDDAERAQLRALRLAVEALLRGQDAKRPIAERLMRAAIEKSWFPMAYLDEELPTPGETWPDMDYDPVPAFEAVRCPTLLIYGADEECVPAPDSINAWVGAMRRSGNRQLLSILSLPDSGHFPAPGTDPAALDIPQSAFSPAYSAGLARWASDWLV